MPTMLRLARLFCFSAALACCCAALLSLTPRADAQPLFPRTKNPFYTPIGTTEIVHQWSFLNFTWRTDAEYSSWWKAGGYKDCMLAGIKVSSEIEYFVSVPRWRANVPATLNRLASDGQGGIWLEPYPSWEMNTPGEHPLALHSVLGFEIDARDRMWILDQGKINSTAAAPGSIKLVIWDIRNNSLVQAHIFPPEIASLDNSFLNDVVVDQINNFAYITDSGIPLNGTELHGGLIVYDFANNSSRRVLDRVTSTQDAPIWIEINGEKVLLDQPMRTGADGIALTPDTKTLYWCPLTSRQVYKISTELLRSPQIPPSLLNAAVVHFIDKGSASDGLAFSADGLLYMTALEKDGILVSDQSGNLKLFTSDNSSMIWPDTIGFDHQGWMVFVTNHLHHFWQDMMNFTVPDNFSIWRTYVNADSYLFPQNATKQFYY